MANRYVKLQEFIVAQSQTDEVPSESIAGFYLALAKLMTAFGDDGFLDTKVRLSMARDSSDHDMTYHEPKAADYTLLRYNISQVLSVSEFNAEAGTNFSDVTFVNSVAYGYTPYGGNTTYEINVEGALLADGDFYISIDEDNETVSDYDLTNNFVFTDLWGDESYVGRGKYWAGTPYDIKVLATGAMAQFTPIVAEFNVSGDGPDYDDDDDNGGDDPGNY